MRYWTLLAALMLVGCAKSEPPASTSTTIAEETAATAEISLDALAGTWDGTITAAGSDTVIALVELTATATPDGWTMSVASAKTPAERIQTPATSVIAAGDSVVVDAGPFASVLRPGQQVATHAVYRMQGEQLAGTIIATYPASGESIELRTLATRRAAH